MDQFDKHIKDKLSNMEMAPPPGFWHTISDQLDTIETPQTVVSNSPHPLYRVLRVAVVFVGFFSLGFLFYNSNTNVEDAPLANVVKKEFPIREVSSTVSPDNNLIKAIDEKSSTPLASNKKASKAKTVSSSISNSVITNESTFDYTPSIPTTDETATAEFSFEQSNIPVYSLKLLSKEIPANDEIIVINSSQQNNTKKPNINTKAKKALPWRF